MKKALVFFLILIFSALVLAFGYLYLNQEKETDKKEENNQDTEKESQKEFDRKREKPKELKLDKEKEFTHLSKVGDTEGAYFARSGWTYWGNVEIKKGVFDWEMMDEEIKRYQSDEAYTLLVIFPYANWDQDACHTEARYEAVFDPKKGGNIKVGKPCDMKAYKKFLTKIVERYDGDGKNDMPGLKLPIKYWEILNEPSMQGGEVGGMGEDLKFFVGTSEEYLDILKASYKTIKKADPEAKVLHAGMAGMHDEFVNFWDPVMAGGAGDYFDIANIHAISVDENTEDLYIIKFKDFLKKHKIKNKPIWITETQFGDLAEEPEDIEEFNKLMARATVFAFAKGADKIFDIENWMHWDRMEKLESEEKDKEEDEKTEKDEEEKDKMLEVIAETSSSQKTYLNLIDKIRL